MLCGSGLFVLCPCAFVASRAACRLCAGASFPSEAQPFASDRWATAPATGSAPGGQLPIFLPDAHPHASNVEAPSARVRGAFGCTKGPVEAMGWLPAELCVTCDSRAPEYLNLDKRSSERLPHVVAAERSELVLWVRDVPEGLRGLQLIGEGARPAAVGGCRARARKRLVMQRRV